MPAQNTHAKDIKKTVDDASVEILSADPILKHIPRVDLARLSIHLNRRYIHRGEKLVCQQTPAEQVFLIEKGSIEIRGRSGRKTNKTNGYVGIEAAIGFDNYKGDAIALSDTTVIGFPKQH